MWERNPVSGVWGMVDVLEFGDEEVAPFAGGEVGLGSRAFALAWLTSDVAREVVDNREAGDVLGRGQAMVEKGLPEC